MSDPDAAEIVARLIRLSPSKGDVTELQHFLSWADVYFYVEDYPGGRRYILARRDPLRIRMYKETQHARPHIHIDYGKEPHIASYALDTGERLAGDLDRRYVQGDLSMDREKSGAVVQHMDGNSEFNRS